MKKCVVSFKRSSPWYTPELRKHKAAGRQLERQYRKSGLTVPKFMYEQHQIEYHNSLKIAKTEYYAMIISSGVSNPRVLFNTINNLTKPITRVNCFTTEQCDDFLKYFSSKIEKMYNTIASVSASSEPLDLHPCNSPLSLFSSFTAVLILFQTWFQQ